jgi:transcriptional regulator with XRE-family HTH domain
MGSLRTSTTLIASKDVGRLLRELRGQRRLTGEQLAYKVGISQSKISKIENGYSNSIDIGQLEKILDILKPSKIIRQRLLMRMSHTAAGLNSQFIYPFPDIVAEGNDLQKVTSLFRCYVCGISGLLQTVEWRTALLKRLGFSEKEISLEIGKTIER